LTENLLGLSGIIILGIMAQWIAWRLKLPSILLLLVIGFIAGPITGFLHPDALFGESLFPIVSLSVALILFEGGLSLRVFELRATGSVVHRLITVGALVTWFLSALAAHYLLGLSLPLSVLLGAIILVTGPTVIIPLLRQVRPSARVASVLRWEGILIDPIGAVLAVLVYEAIISGSFHEVPSVAMMGMLKTALAGGGAGVLGALLIVVFLKYYLLPDFLRSPFTLMSVVAVFSGSNLFQPESGLLAVTVMGVALTNQKFVPIKHIIEFKENLRVLLLAVLFIVLAARLDPADLGFLGFGSFVFLAFLIFVVRPVSVFLSSAFSELNWRERVFLSFVAPRGIVAAAVASVFALRLAEAGYIDARVLAPVTFLVITGTVIVYGLGAPVLARRLDLSQPAPQGVLMAGAYPWAVSMAVALKEAGFKVLMADTNWNNIAAARMNGLQTYYGSVLSETVLQDIDLEGIGRLVAMTPNYGVNSLAVIRFGEVFESSGLYQLTPHGEEKRDKERVSSHLHGRFLFGPEVTFAYLTARFSKGAVIKKTRLSEVSDFKAHLARYRNAVPLFLINEAGELSFFTVDKQLNPLPGQTVMSLVDAEDGKEA